VWTGQRQGDLLALPWSGYDGRDITLRQRKGGKHVTVECSSQLKAALDEAAKSKRGPLILTSSLGRPWTRNGFKSAWRDASKAAGIVDRTYHDLRGTAVTRFALAGSTEAEIASITGHTLGDVRSILEKHYLHRDPELGRNAVRKREARTKLQTELQTGKERAALEHAKD
jgi:integrase